MADCSSTLERGLQLVQQAIQYDSVGNLREALRLYSLALEAFVSVLKYERNERIVGTLRGKVKVYMARAEEIQNILTKEETHHELTLPSVPGSSPPSKTPVPVAVTHEPTPVKATQQPSPATNKPTNTAHARSIFVKNGQLGVTYEKLFGDVLRTSPVQIVVEDPYIRARHQVQNFLRLCELIVRIAPTVKKILLVTYFGEEEERNRNKSASFIQEIKTSLEEYGVVLELHENPHLHDREIRLDNGWVVKLGRGLDIYQKTKSNFSLGHHDLELRPTCETTIEIFRRM